MNFGSLPRSMYVELTRG
uniref:Uncharacterized protein n=1 Tax=Anguilla anguilla TaxID=7936 RepID=A0A0E9RZ75_ANGAN